MRGQAWSGAVRRALATWGVGAYFAAVAIAVFVGARRPDFSTPVGLTLLASLAIVTTIAATLAGRLARARRLGEAGLESVPAATLARLLLYGLLPGFTATTIATAALALTPASPQLLLLFACFALAGIGAALLAALQLRGGSEPRRSLRTLDTIAFNAVVLLLASEIALRGLQRVAPSQLLWDDDSAAGSVVALRRCPEPWYFRYRCNSRGYPDEEFVDPAPDDYAVAVVADSFGVGMVPWSHHFATLAERALRERLGGRYARVAVDSHGVSGLDLPEYQFLIDTEIADRAYARVVLCIFAGNDFGEVTLPAGGLAQRMMHFQGWLAPEAMRRAWLVLRGTEWSGPAPADLPDEPAFLADPSLEPPTFTPDQFLRIELDRVRYTAANAKASEPVYRQGFEILDAIRARLGERLVVMVIPDEFQVDDALWERLLAPAAELYVTKLRGAEARAALERDYPQRRLREWADARGVPLLDLLPALRAAEREARTYHLRDTHWNAHGNRVAARELVAELLRLEEAR